MSVIKKTVWQTSDEKCWDTQIKAEEWQVKLDIMNALNEAYDVVNKHWDEVSFKDLAEALYTLGYRIGKAVPDVSAAP